MPSQAITATPRQATTAKPSDHRKASRVRPSHAGKAKPNRYTPVRLRSGDVTAPAVPASQEKTPWPAGGAAAPAPAWAGGSSLGGFGVAAPSLPVMSDASQRRRRTCSSVCSVQGCGPLPAPCAAIAWQPRAWLRQRSCPGIRAARTQVESDGWVRAGCQSSGKGLPDPAVRPAPTRPAPGARDQLWTFRCLRMGPSSRSPPCAAAAARICPGSVRLATQAGRGTPGATGVVSLQSVLTLQPASTSES